MAARKSPRRASSRPTPRASGILDFLMARPQSAFSFENSSRASWALVFLGICVAVCVGRLIYLQVIAAPELSAEAAAVRTVTVSTTPRRGTIYDRNGNILAVSVDAKTIYANPTEVSDPNTAAVLIANIVGGDVDTYRELLTCGGPLDTFVYVKRQASLEACEELEELDLDGIYFVDDTRREYPYGSVGGQLVGFCNVDGEGVSGLELQYDDVLKGSGGTYTYEVGLYGIPIAGESKDGEERVDGQDIIVSIDIEYQRMVEEDCKAYADAQEMPYTSCVVMDAETGEIYAACSLPLFNPSDTSEVEEGATQLKCVTNAVEPGSIFKTVSAMMLLETGTMKPDDTIWCPAEIEADEYTISDAHARSDQEMSLRDIIDRSSNVGISLSIENMGFDRFHEYLEKYEIHNLTNVDYPGESSGYLADFDTWSKVQGYNLTFGQGISVTPMQMVRFYGALLNDGVAVTPHFLLGYPQTGEMAEYDESQIIENTSVISDMVSMLKTVVSEGTATSAQIEGYSPAGKTGTAETADENGGYKEGIYNLGFVGFLADSSSSLVCYAGAADVPKEGTVAPLFKDIMTDAIERYRIVSEGEAE